MGGLLDLGFQNKVPDWLFVAPGATGIFIYSFAFALGIAIGSFVNVVIYRAPRRESVATGRSHCVSCGGILGFTELIPVVSFLLQRGRCKKCGERISPRYVAVELMTGCLFVSLLAKYSVSFEFFCYSIFFALLIGAAFIDIEWMIIPNRLVFYLLMIALVAFAFNAASPMAVYGGSNPLIPLLGIIPGALFFFLIHIFSIIAFKSENSIGMGDIKLLLPIGIILGFRHCFAAVFFSVIAGGIVGLALVALGVKTRKDPIPFGPFLVAGSYLAMMLS